MTGAKHIAFGLVAAVAALANAAPARDATMATVPEGLYRAFLPERPGPGAEAARPAILVKTFALDVLPVTNEAFLAFVTAHPQWRRGQASRLFVDESYLKHWSGAIALGIDAPAQSPVVGVSWFAARAYCAWKEKRLPSTAEWELAASPAPSELILAWYAEPMPKVLPRVGATRANPLGIRDLHGLVWEWTEDFNSAMSGDDGRNGSSTESGLFCGAGSLGALDPEDYATFMRVAFRSSLKGRFALGNLGFRCAK